jgi:hypothetical protein
MASSRMLFVASLVVFSDCGPGVPKGEVVVVAPRQMVNVLTPVELQRFENAGKAIATLRPQWLRGRSSHSAPPSVFVDGVLTPGTQVLAGLSLHHVREIRYLSRTEASVRFGSGNEGGAIVVTTHR